MLFSFMSTSPQLSSSLKDPSKLSFESTRTRRLILGSYWVVVLLALPLWWSTTSIERLSLPSSRVRSLSEKHLRFQIHLHLDTRNGGDATVIAKSWQKIFEQSAAVEDRWAGLDVQVHPKQHKGKAVEHNFDVYKSEVRQRTKTRQIALGHIPSVWEQMKLRHKTDISLSPRQISVQKRHASRVSSLSCP